MSKVVAVVKDVPSERRREVLARLRAITGRSLGEINRCLISGEPVIEVVLFLNDHEAVAAQLRELLFDLPPLGAKVQLFELTSVQQFSPQMNNHEINADTLNNILETHVMEKQQSQEMWDKHGHT